MDKRIITDKPGLVGYVDGLRTVIRDDRSSRKDQIPEEQQDQYSSGWRRGAKRACKDLDELED